MHTENRILKVLSHPDGKRRLLIVSRGDGQYGFEEELLSDDPYEMCWLPHGQYSLAVCASPETAEREARGRVAWLRELSSG